jgi:RHS repeat-associated protein
MGLDYFLARYYSAAQGRFTSPDEFNGGIVDPFTGQQLGQPGPLPYADITDPQTLNKYAYVRNSPLRYVDPDGHCFWDVCAVETYVAAAAAAGAIYFGSKLAVAVYDYFHQPTRSQDESGTNQPPPPPTAKPQEQSTPANPPPPGGSGRQEGERHGGGKTGQKQNVDRAQSAKDKFDASKKEYDQLKAKPNKTKLENQKLDKLRKQVDHWRKKAAEKSEEHARTRQHS